MKYKYRFSRYKNEQIRNHDDLESAIQDAVSDMEYETAYAIEITDENGKVIIDHEDLVREWKKRYEGDI